MGDEVLHTPNTTTSKVLNQKKLPPNEKFKDYRGEYSYENIYLDISYIAISLNNLIIPF